MFNKLIQWLKDPLSWFKWMFTEIWRQSCSFIWSIWSVVLIASATIFSLFDFVEKLVSKVIYAISTLVLPQFDLGLGSAMYYLELMNTFFPVSETLAFIVIYVVVLGILLLYRSAKSLKSWIWAG